MVAPVQEADGAGDVNEAGRLNIAERRWARIGAAIGVLFFVLLATWAQPWRMFDEGPYSSDFFDAQAHSILNGHLDIPEETAGLEGITIDGKTQIYFGIGPAIMRLPLSGWNEELNGRLSIASMAVAVAVLALASARLLGRSRRTVDPSAVIDARWFGVMAAGSALCTPALFAASRAGTYNEAVLWGCAASLVGLDLIIRWWREPTRRHFIAAVAGGILAISCRFTSGMAPAIAISCRFTSGMAPAIAIAIFGVVLTFRRQWSRAFVAVAGGLGAFFAFAFVNWLRFRQLFSVPAEDQLYSQINAARKEFLDANGGRIAGPQFLPTTITRYFSPFAMGWQRFFPFVKFGPLQRPVGDVVLDGVSGQSSSITLGAPVYVVLAVIGTWWTALRDSTREWTVIAGAACLAALGTLSFGSIQHRYLVDLVPAVVVLACPGVWLVTKRLSTASVSLRRSLIGVAAVVSFFAVWLQVGLALENRAYVQNPEQAETNSILRLQNAIDARLFGGTIPNLRGAGGEDLPQDGNTDGDLVILGDCSALYRFSALSKWVVVERKPGGGRRFLLTGTIGEGVTPVMRGWLWTLTAERTSEGVVFSYRKSDGYEVRSLPESLNEGPITLDIAVDQSHYGSMTVHHGEAKLFEGMALGLQYPEPSPGWTSTPGPAPLCESLLSRLDESR